MTHVSADITRLLRAVSAGDAASMKALVEAVYGDLKRLAQTHMNAERVSHTLQPTAVVHEAYLKLIQQRSATVNDRVHFFALASQLIRRILVDHARGKQRSKRGGGGVMMDIADVDPAAKANDVDLIELDDALAELAAIDERQARVVELRFFGGMTLDEIAAVLNVSRRSIDRDWSVARTWLCFRLSDQPRQDARDNDGP